MLTIYRAPYSTNCERISLAMGLKSVVPDEEVVISYDDRSAVEEASGQGLVPVLVEDGIAVADSQRILRHLDDVAPEPGLYPASDVLAARVRVFSEWFDAVWKVEPNLLEAELAGAADEGRDPDPVLVATLGTTIQERLAIFESLLEDGPYLIGEDLTAADLIAFPFLKYAFGRDPEDPDLFHRVIDEHQQLGDSHPRLREWIARIDALPRAFGP
ncbi:glutathione S-transferase family protein [Thermoleophilia bacterium SCSIO 60948]|nr:glutathione S-transferase family protein [Thermoleophilia bacterium SCSIO 60948]